MKLQTEFAIKQGTSKIWKTFGYLVLLCEPEDVDGDAYEFEFAIAGGETYVLHFIACSKCYRVYSISSRGGTSTIGTYSFPASVDPNQMLITPMIRGASAAAQSPLFVSLPSTEKEAFHSTLIKFVINKIRAFSIVEDPSLHEFAQQLVDTAVRVGRFEAKQAFCSTKALTKRIDDVAANQIQQIKADLKNTISKLNLIGA